MHLDGGAFEELLLRIAVERGIAFDPRPDGVDEVLSRLARSVDLAAARLPEPDQRRWLAAALSALSHQVQLSTLPDPPPLEQRLAIVAAVITNPHGVVVVRRRDRVPLWAFPGGKIEPGESPAAAAVREVAEETGLHVSAGAEIGRRAHPATGRTIIYLACSPTGDDQLRVGAPREVAEVRWAQINEVDRLMPDLYEPARQHVAAILNPAPPMP